MEKVTFYTKGVRIGQLEKEVKELKDQIKEFKRLLYRDTRLHLVSSFPGQYPFGGNSVGLDTVVELILDYLDLKIDYQQPRSELFTLKDKEPA